MQHAGRKKRAPAETPVCAAAPLNDARGLDQAQTAFRALMLCCCRSHTPTFLLLLQTPPAPSAPQDRLVDEGTATNSSSAFFSAKHFRCRSSCLQSYQDGVWLQELATHSLQRMGRGMHIWRAIPAPNSCWRSTRVNIAVDLSAQSQNVPHDQAPTIEQVRAFHRRIVVRRLGAAAGSNAQGT